MLYSGKDLKKIKEKELQALLFIENNMIDSAEKILLQNIDAETDSNFTYDLLIRVYEFKEDYQNLIKILNTAIKSAGKKDFYRNLKKKLIISKIIKDIYNT